YRPGADVVRRLPARQGANLGRGTRAGAALGRRGAVMTVKPAFPDALPVHIQDRLRRRTEKYRADCAAEATRAVWTPSDRDAAAERVARAAQTLLEDISSWYQRYSAVGDDEDAREMVEARLAARRAPTAVNDFNAPIAE